MNKKAYTLVEMMITLAIFSVMIMAIYTTFLVSQRSWTDFMSNLAPKQNLRNAMTSMVIELRDGRDTFITKDKDTVLLTFHRPSIGQVKYMFAKSGPQAGQIIREVNSNQNLIGHGIKDLDFNLPTNAEVIITMTAGDKQSFELKQKVALRSLTGLIAQSAYEKIM